LTKFSNRVYLVIFLIVFGQCLRDIRCW